MLNRESASDAAKPGPTARDKWLETMSELQDKFDKSGKSVVSDEKRLFDELKALMVHVEKRSGEVAKDGISEDSPLRAVAESARKEIRACVRAWKGAVDQHDRNTEFREDYGDSLLVYIYGLVKSGKSSLGNFVAYGEADPGDDVIEARRRESRPPAFFVRAGAGAPGTAKVEAAGQSLEQAGKFFTDAEEATNEIQGFKLPGLTWVDSPGLGSVTKANEELAREYAACADLILVAMNSAQAGRRPEVEAVADLLRRRKPMMILLTRADEMEWDEEDGQIVKKRVMKSDQAREEMAQWVKSALEKEVRQSGAAAPEICMVSTRYAEENATADSLEKSGMAALFRLMTKVATDAGVTMKRKTPRNNLNAFIDKIVEGKEGLGLEAVKQKIESLDKCVKTSIEDLDKGCQKAIEKTKQELRPMVYEAVKKHGRNSRALRKSCIDKIGCILRRNVQDAVSDLLTQVQPALEKMAALYIPEAGTQIKDKTETVLTTHKRRTKGRMGAVGTSLGVAIGNFLGGPASMGLVAWLGGTLGRALGKDETWTEEEEITVGDTSREVRQKLIEHCDRGVEKETKKVFDCLAKEFLEPVRAYTKAVHSRLENFKVVAKEIKG